jgi:hypothetical protein
MFAGMQETNLGAMLDALRSNAEACKLEGNREFADGACVRGRTIAGHLRRLAPTLAHARRLDGAGNMEAAVEAYTRAAELSDPVRARAREAARAERRALRRSGAALDTATDTPSCARARTRSSTCRPWCCSATAPRR